jgi:hypothetical protein
MEGNLMKRRISVGVLGAVLVSTAMLGAQSATAAPTDKNVTLTSQQLTDAGFPLTPNTVAWAPGTASLPTNTAAPWEDVVITGRAPSYANPGQKLTMSRYVPANTKGDGVMKPMNITAVVQPNRTFTMHFQLGLPGTYGYSVGYSTGGMSPEMVAFQFQFTTTGAAPSSTSKWSAAAVQLSGPKLAAAGFTTTPNVVGWGGTATLSTSKARAGSPVTIAGRAPAELKPGTVLTLQRFAATDKKGSGSFEPVGSISTVVKPDGSFELTFEVNEQGRYGYTLGAGLNEEWIGIEFQLKTT